MGTLYPHAGDMISTEPTLGGPGEGGQLILEGFFGGAIAEAAPGCRVERGHNAGKVAESANSHNRKVAHILYGR